MTDAKPDRGQRERSRLDFASLLPSFLWIGMTAVCLGATEGSHRAAVIVSGTAGLVASLAFYRWVEHLRWVAPLKKLEERIDALTQDPSGSAILDTPPDLWPLANSVDALAGAVRAAQVANASSWSFVPPGQSGTTGTRRQLCLRRR